MSALGQQLTHPLVGDGLTFGFSGRHTPAEEALVVFVPVPILRALRWPLCNGCTGDPKAGTFLACYRPTGHRGLCEELDGQRFQGLAACSEPTGSWTIPG